MNTGLSPIQPAPDYIRAGFTVGFGLTLALASTADTAVTAVTTAPAASGR